MTQNCESLYQSLLRQKAEVLANWMEVLGTVGDSQFQRWIVDQMLTKLLKTVPDRKVTLVQSIHGLPGRREIVISRPDENGARSNILTWSCQWQQSVATRQWQDEVIG